MSDAANNATLTTEFGHEFEVEREAWLRRRFVWYAGLVVVFNLALFILPNFVALIVHLVRDTPADRRWPTELLGLSGVTASTALYAWAWIRARRQRVNGAEVLRLVFWLIIISGVLPLAIGLIARGMGATPKDAMVVTTNLGVGVTWMLNVFVAHLFACLFLPWTPWESFRPLWPLLALNAVGVLLSSDDWFVKPVAIVASPLVGAPGALICWYRHSRFRERFTISMIRGRYSEMKRELLDARRIHEDLFPDPINHGPILLRYRYEPMRQIGGDYLYAAPAPSPAGPGRALNVVVLDVTGHGITAALTVNRLHGELDRVLAEQPDIRPGEVLRLLNRYAHLTLATHSVYLTAFCARADADAGTLEYASGGHPPAFLRAVDGTIEQLDSTSFVLGACAAEDYNPEPRTLRFGRGDALIAYTDGAIEARDAAGRCLGIAGLQRALAAGRGRAGEAADWTAAILQTVNAHRFGPPADDTLIIELSRPVSDTAAAPPSPVRRTRTSAIAAPVDR